MKFFPLQAALVLGSFRVFDITLFDFEVPLEVDEDEVAAVVNLGGDFQLGFQPPLAVSELEEFEEEG